jgi:phage gpG-like protein
LEILLKVEILWSLSSVFSSVKKYQLLTIKCLNIVICQAKVFKYETRPAWAGFKTAEEGRTKIM